MGVIAIEMAGTKLEWDAGKMRFKNCATANPFLNPPCRTGWKL